MHNAIPPGSDDTSRIKKAPTPPCCFIRTAICFTAGLGIPHKYHGGFKEGNSSWLPCQHIAIRLPSGVPRLAATCSCISERIHGTACISIHESDKGFFIKKNPSFPATPTAGNETKTKSKQSTSVPNHCLKIVRQGWVLHVYNATLLCGMRVVQLHPCKNELACYSDFPLHSLSSSV